MAVGAFHHQTPAQVLSSCSWIVEVCKGVRHGRDPFSWRNLPATRPLILARQAVGQPIQSWVQRPGHVGVCGLRAPKWRGRVRGEFADERGEQVGIAGLSWLDQAVDMDVELLLFKGAGENTVGEVLHPGEQRQVQIVAAVTAQHVDTQKDLALCYLLACCLALHTHKKTQNVNHCK